MKNTNYFYVLFLSALMVGQLSTYVFAESIKTQNAQSDYCYGIKKDFINDPLWSTLSVGDKEFVMNSPQQQLVWNRYLELRQNALEQVAIALGLTNEQMTYPVKRIIYEALSRGGDLFSPIERADIFIAMISEEAPSLPIQENKRFELLFVKDGVITSISREAQSNKILVDSSIFEQRGYQVDLCQLDTFLINNGVKISDHAMSRLTLFVDDVLRYPSLCLEEGSQALFIKACTSLLNNRCRVLVHFPDLTMHDDRYQLIDELKKQAHNNSYLSIIRSPRL